VVLNLIAALVPGARFRTTPLGTGDLNSEDAAAARVHPRCQLVKGSEVRQ